MASRKLEDLSPLIRPKAEEFLSRCHAEGIEVLITCTYRSQAQQDALWALGRSKPGGKVTWTKVSKHSAVDAQGLPAALAFDYVPMRGGKCVWSVLDRLWLRTGAIGELCGLKWGGRWKTPDRPHMEV